MAERGEKARRLMTTVLAWPDDVTAGHGKRVKSRAVLILELLAYGRDPDRMEREARGLEKLLRTGQIPDHQCGVVRSVLALVAGGEDGAWGPAEVRAWVDRHGGNLAACARRLGVPRTMLQRWAQEGGSAARALPPYIQAHMATIDQHELQGD